VLTGDRRSGRGRLVSCEGIDASGKSTVARLLADRIAADGRQVLFLDRKSAVASLDGYLADHLAALRSLIWEYPPDAMTSRLGFTHWSHLIGAWFAAVDHTVVRPGLDRGLWIVADSWFYKFAARFALSQGLQEGLAPFAGVSRPDTAVWLDVPPEECVLRRSELRSTERGEWQGLDGGARTFVEYQGRVRQVYRELAGREAWFTMGSASPKDAADRAFDHVATATVTPAGTSASPYTAMEETQ
jgi:thymidylate kinase